MIQLGVDRLITDQEIRQALRGRRVALLGHPASMTSDGRHSLDALAALGDLQLSAAFGPQHGMRGEKQDNMVESADYADPVHGIPVFSLYGEVRRPTARMMDSFDVLLVDLQDIGTRIYTYLTTLAYLVEACAASGKSLWVLDRPNPAGRPVEGGILVPGWESFVGAGPIIMRHGLTLGEIAPWLAAVGGHDLDLRVVAMTGYDPDQAPGYGWPLADLPWVNPSPNASSLNMTRCFPGTVMLEGTTLSEGRGTTVALELVGAPELDFARILARMQGLRSDWLDGALLRPCWFEPIFHKHAGRLCSGLQIHTDCHNYKHHQFRPYRLVALMLKALRIEYPDYPIWREFAYEYEHDRLAIDLITGGTGLREWVDDPAAEPMDLERALALDESRWIEETGGYRIYP